MKKNILEILAFIVQLLMYITIFALQTLAPLMTFIFLILTFINPTSVLMTIFIISAIAYFLGYFTHSFALKSVTSIAFKSHFDTHHPVFSTLLDMIVMFGPSFIMALVICLIFGEFTYYLHNAIMVNWFYRIIRFFKNNKKV